MSVGLIIITHGEIGKALYDTALTVIGSCPIRTEIISIGFSANRELTLTELSKTIDNLDHGEGVLILTDMYGATPSNIACRIERQNIEVVAGINLPMLIRVFNYPTLPLLPLMEKAISGGSEGILYCGLSKDSYATQGS